MFKLKKKCLQYVVLLLKWETIAILTGKIILFNFFKQLFFVTGINNSCVISHLFFMYNLQAVTGITMSLIMKESSNVMRLFVIATAPLCTTVFSLYLFNLKIHIEFLVSLCCVILAAMLYNHKGKKYEPGGVKQEA